MAKSIIELIIGDLEEKRAYRRFMKRVNALPKDYRFAFKKMRNYLYNMDLSGCGFDVFTDLLDLLEASAARNTPVLQVTGGDAAAFCDQLIDAANTQAATQRELLNREIWEKLHRKEA